MIVATPEEEIKTDVPKDEDKNKIQPLKSPSK